MVSRQGVQERHCRAHGSNNLFRGVLSRLYIPEEMERMNDDVTPSGRQIVHEPSQDPRKAAQAVLQAKLAGTMPLNPPPTENLAPAQPAPQPAPNSALPKKSGKLPESAYHPENVPHAAPMAPFPALKGTVELDSTEPKSPIIRGDIAELLPTMQEKFVLEWAGDWWRYLPGDHDALIAFIAGQGYAVNQVPRSSGRAIGPGKPAVMGRGSSPQQAAPAADRSPVSAARSTAERSSGRAESVAAAPAVVSGTIERVNSGMAGKYPVKQVTLILADKTKPCYGCFDKKLFADLDAGLGKFAEFVVQKNKGYTNIVALRKIGSKKWDADGTPIIQRKDQEAGQRTLY
jgi:hypothetical protein